MNSFRAMTVSTLTLAALAGTASAQKGAGLPFVDTMQAWAEVPNLLSIVSTAGQQQIEVTVGPMPGEVRVQGVPTIPSDFVFTNIHMIEVTTGTAQDFVAFRILTDVVPDINVTTGAGLSDVIFEYLIPFTPTPVSTNVTHTGSSSADKVAVIVESRAQTFSGNWNMNHFGGDNETFVAVNSPEASDSLSLNVASNAGNGVDKIDVSVTSAAASLNVNLGGALGANNDFAALKIDGLAPATTTTAFNLNLGGGQDASSIEILSRGGLTTTTGSVLGGAGLDTIVYKLEGDGDLNATFNGGNDADYIDLSLKGLITGTPSLLGGNGNDELKITLDGPILSTPVLNGGAGFDIGIGFGTFISVEQIN